MSCKICKKGHLIGGKYQYEGDGKVPCSCGELVTIPHQTVTYIGLSTEGKHHYALNTPIICLRCEGKNTQLIYNCDDKNNWFAGVEVKQLQPVNKEII